MHDLQAAQARAESLQGELSTVQTELLQEKDKRGDVGIAFADKVKGYSDQIASLQVRSVCQLLCGFTVQQTT